MPRTITESDILKWKRMNIEQDASRHACAVARNALGPLIADREEQAEKIKRLLEENAQLKAEGEEGRAREWSMQKDVETLIDEKLQITDDLADAVNNLHALATDWQCQQIEIATLREALGGITRTCEVAMMLTETGECVASGILSQIHNALALAANPKPAEEPGEETR